MKILRVVYEWPPPWTGLAPALYGMTKAQTKLGHHITVFCARWPKAGALELLSNVDIKAFLRAPIKGTALVTTAPLMAIYFVFWRLFHKVDVLHLHGHFGLYIYIYKFLFGFIDKTPIVAHFPICSKARENEILHSGKRIYVLSKFIEWPLHKLSEVLALKLASYCICVSESVKNDFIKEYSADEKKLIVIESGVDTDIFKPCNPYEKLDLRRRVGIKEDAVVVSNIGAFVDRKNIHLIVESLKFLPSNFVVMLVGKGEKAYVDKLKEIVASEGLGLRVKFVGEKSNPELPIYYQLSDVFVLPSVYEGFPKVVLEALSCGISVAASGFKLPLDIKGLYEVKVHSADSLAELITKITEESVKIDINLIRSRFSWDAQARKVDFVYDKLRV